MTDTGIAPFRTLAPLYRERGLYPRPVRPGTKIPSINKWQVPDPEIASGQLQDWLSVFAAHGIGVVTGSPLPDGTMLGALDIDRDDYVAIAQAVLRGEGCGRIGARGAVFFVRVSGNGRYRPFTIKRESESPIKVGELLCEKRFCVLPPTIHPVTNLPYRWIGKPLHEVDYSDLPLVEA